MNSTVVIAAFCSGLLAAILTSLLTHHFTIRRNRQNACLTTVALLDGYEEELRNGLNVLETLGVWMDIQMGRTSPNPLLGDPYHSPNDILPNKFWSSFKPTHDGIYELWKLDHPNLRPPFNQAPRLPTHLKNCFEHITQRHISILGNLQSPCTCAEIDGTWKNQIGYLEPQHEILDQCIGGQKMTLDVLLYAKRMLIQKGNKPWYYWSIE